MANIESNTLLEKLSEINDIKNRIRQMIINIGGKEYIDENTPFSQFPAVLSSMYSDIVNLDRLSEYLVYGGDLSEIAEKDDLSSLDLLPYISKMQDNKQKLVDNLRTIGIEASLDESFESLVNKVLKG